MVEGKYVVMKVSKTRQHADHCLHDIKQNRYLLSEEETAIIPSLTLC